MGVKSIVATVLVLAGIIGLIIGITGIFGKNVTAQSPWIFAILGFVFFSSGIGLLKNTGPRGA
jgi:uncharacterized membrane protein